jgi:peptidoglycan/LPS O-acetylase OafA/YrhL
LAETDERASASRRRPQPLLWLPRQGERAHGSLVAGKHARRRNLDGIRAIAVLAVFGTHADVPWASGGWVGVDAFFVLSGYLITTLLLNEHDKTDSVSLKRFWARRMLRLWPALVGMLIVGCFTHGTGVYPVTLSAYVHVALLSVTYVYDFVTSYLGAPTSTDLAHTWTLGVEMYFYLLWPILLVFLLRKRRGLVVPSLIALSVASVAATLILFQLKPTGLEFYYAPHTQVLPILTGCLLAAVRHEGMLPAMGPRWGSGFAIIGLAGLLIRVGLVPTPSPYGTSFYLPMLGGTAATWLLLLGLDLNPDSFVSKLLSWEPLAALGMVSYGFYLYQSPMILSLGAHVLFVSFYGQTILILLMTIGASVASWFLIEQQFLKLKDRLGARVDATAAPSHLAALHHEPHVAVATSASG